MQSPSAPPFYGGYYAPPTYSFRGNGNRFRRGRGAAPKGGQRPAPKSDLKVISVVERRFHKGDQTFTLQMKVMEGVRTKKREEKNAGLANQLAARAVVGVAPTTAYTMLGREKETALENKTLNEISKTEDLDLALEWTRINEAAAAAKFDIDKLCPDHTPLVEHYRIVAETGSDFGRQAWCLWLKRVYGKGAYDAFTRRDTAMSSLYGPNNRAGEAACDDCELSARRGYATSEEFNGMMNSRKNFAENVQRLAIPDPVAKAIKKARSEGWIKQLDNGYSFKFTGSVLWPSHVGNKAQKKGVVSNGDLSWKGAHPGALFTPVAHGERVFFANGLKGTASVGANVVTVDTDVDLSSLPGCSGLPCFNAGGEVVGILHGYEGAKVYISSRNKIFVANSPRVHLCSGRPRLELSGRAAAVRSDTGLGTSSASGLSRSSEPTEGASEEEPEADNALVPYGGGGAPTYQQSTARAVAIGSASLALAAAESSDSDNEEPPAYQIHPRKPVPRSSNLRERLEDNITDSYQLGARLFLNIGTPLDQCTEDLAFDSINLRELVKVLDKFTVQSVLRKLQREGYDDDHCRYVQIRAAALERAKTSELAVRWAACKLAQKAIISVATCDDLISDVTRFEETAAEHLSAQQDAYIRASIDLSRITDELQMPEAQPSATEYGVSVHLPITGRDTADQLRGEERCALHGAEVCKVVVQGMLTPSELVQTLAPLCPRIRRAGLALDQWRLDAELVQSQTSALADVLIIADVNETLEQLVSYRNQQAKLEEVAKRESRRNLVGGASSLFRTAKTDSQRRIESARATRASADGESSDENPPALPQRSIAARVSRRGGLGVNKSPLFLTLICLFTLVGCANACFTDGLAWGVAIGPNCPWVGDVRIWQTGCGNTGNVGYTTTAVDFNYRSLSVFGTTYNAYSVWCNSNSAVPIVIVPVFSCTANNVHSVDSAPPNGDWHAAIDHAFNEPGGIPPPQLRDRFGRDVIVTAALNGFTGAACFEGKIYVHLSHSFIQQTCASNGFVTVDYDFIAPGRPGFFMGSTVKNENTPATVTTARADRTVPCAVSTFSDFSSYYLDSHLNLQQAYISPHVHYTTTHNGFLPIYGGGWIGLNFAKNRLPAVTKHTNCEAVTFLPCRNGYRVPLIYTANCLTYGCSVTNTVTMAEPLAAYEYASIFLTGFNPLVRTLTSAFGFEPADCGEKSATVLGGIVGPIITPFGRVENTIVVANGLPFMVMDQASINSICSSYTGLSPAPAQDYEAVAQTGTVGVYWDYDLYLNPARDVPTTIGLGTPYVPKPIRRRLPSDSDFSAAFTLPVYPTSSTTTTSTTTTSTTTTTPTTTTTTATTTTPTTTTTTTPSTTTTTASTSTTTAKASTTGAPTASHSTAAGAGAATAGNSVSPEAVGPTAPAATQAIIHTQPATQSAAHHVAASSFTTAGPVGQTTAAGCVPVPQLGGACLSGGWTNVDGCQVWNSSLSPSAAAASAATLSSAMVSSCAANLSGSMSAESLRNCTVDQLLLPNLVVGSRARFDTNYSQYIEQVNCSALKSRLCPDADCNLFFAPGSLYAVIETRFSSGVNVSALNASLAHTSSVILEQADYFRMGDGIFSPERDPENWVVFGSLSINEQALQFVNGLPAPVFGYGHGFALQPIDDPIFTSQLGLNVSTVLVLFASTAPTFIITSPTDRWRATRPVACSDAIGYCIAGDLVVKINGELKTGGPAIVFEKSSLLAAGEFQLRIPSIDVTYNGGTHRDSQPLINGIAVFSAQVVSNITASDRLFVDGVGANFTPCTQRQFRCVACAGCDNTTGLSLNRPSSVAGFNSYLHCHPPSHQSFRVGTSSFRSFHPSSGSSSFQQLPADLIRVSAAIRSDLNSLCSKHGLVFLPSIEASIVSSGYLASAENATVAFLGSKAYISANSPVVVTGSRFDTSHTVDLSHMAVVGGGISVGAVTHVIGTHETNSFIGPTLTPPARYHYYHFLRHAGIYKSAQAFEIAVIAMSSLVIVFLLSLPCLASFLRKRHKGGLRCHLCIIFTIFLIAAPPCDAQISLVVNSVADTPEGNSVADASILATIVANPGNVISGTVSFGSKYEEMPFQVAVASTRCIIRTSVVGHIHSRHDFRDARIYCRYIFGGGFNNCGFPDSGSDCATKQPTGRNFSYGNPNNGYICSQTSLQSSTHCCTDPPGQLFANVANAVRPVDPIVQHEVVDVVAEAVLVFNFNGSAHSITVTDSSEGATYTANGATFRVTTSTVSLSCPRPRYIFEYQGQLYDGSLGVPFGSASAGQLGDVIIRRAYDPSAPCRDTYIAPWLTNAQYGNCGVDRWMTVAPGWDTAVASFKSGMIASYANIRLNGYTVVKQRDTISALGGTGGSIFVQVRMTGGQIRSVSQLASVTAASLQSSMEGRYNSLDRGSATIALTLSTPGRVNIWCDDGACDPQSKSSETTSLTIVTSINSFTDHRPITFHFNSFTFTYSFSFKEPESQFHSVTETWDCVNGVLSNGQASKDVAGACTTATSDGSGKWNPLAGLGSFFANIGIPGIGAIGGFSSLLLVGGIILIICSCKK